MLGKCALAGGAGLAVVKQADAAVRAKVDFRTLQVHRPLTAGANALGQPRQRRVIAQFFAALLWEKVQDF